MTTQTDYIAEAIDDYLGARCIDFDADCMTCQAWKQYDDWKEAHLWFEQAQMEVARSLLEAFEASK